jgi:hypothetical protein
MRSTVPLAAFLLAHAFAGCPPRPHVVHVVANDYALQIPDTLAAGLVHFQFENGGLVPHELAIGRLRAGAGMREMMDAAQHGLRLRDAPEHYLDGAPFGVLFAWPGKTSLAQLTVTLESGQRYAVLCTLRDSLTAPEHAALGMMRIVQVP